MGKCFYGHSGAEPKSQGGGAKVWGYEEVGIVEGLRG
jgi:hypothetical protein